MSTQPNGQQLDQLTQALLNAFGHDELTRLVRAQFDQALEWITPVAGKRDLTTITSDLVAYFASQTGGIKKLLAAAVRENPLNTDLSALVMQWSDVDFAPRPLAPEHPGSAPNTHSSTTVDTGGGAYISGSVDTGGGAFIGRDQVTHGDRVAGDKISGDKVAGDKVAGNKVSGDSIITTIGDNSCGIAVGKNITQSITSGVDAARLDALFARMLQAAAAAPAKRSEAVRVVGQLQEEAAKADKADDARLATLIESFVDLVPGGVSAVTDAFGSPILTRIAGPVTEYVLKSLKRT